MKGSLLRGLFLVGLVGFGGGSALIPVVERELVDRRKLLSAEDYVRHTVVANITPGALPVKLAASAGLTLGGWGLAVLAVLAVTLPGVVGTISLMALSDFLGPAALRVISSASVGITAFIVVLLIGYIVKVHVGSGQLPLFVLITATAASLTSLDPLVKLIGTAFQFEPSAQPPRMDAVVLIVGALLGIVVVTLFSSRGREPRLMRQRKFPIAAMRPALLACAAFLALTAVGLVAFAVLLPNGARLGALLALSSITSFGGGEAYIAVADGYFVKPGFVDAATFYTQLVPIANALPGPILVKVAAGVGYLAGAPHGTAIALLLATAATFVAAGACCALMLPVLGAYLWLRKEPIVINIGRYILPVICGLLISVSATMLDVAAKVGEEAGVAPGPLLIVMLLAIALMTWLHLKRLASDILMLVLAGGASLLLLSILGPPA